MQKETHQFDEVRPYYDSEVQPAIQKLIAHPLFEQVSRFINPEASVEEIKQAFGNINTVFDFQKIFSYQGVAKIMNDSTNGITVDGIENIEKNKAYLIISNHRDIVLDSAFLEYLLFKNGHDTTQITIGDNLLINDFIITLGKLNKVFTLKRGGGKIEVYKNAMIHSAYIRHTICKDNQSIWIAQREGRTKNGSDTTQESLIKMLTAGEKAPGVALECLNIIPLAISYEYEPCDDRKTREVYISRNDTYVKETDEDLNSILAGVSEQKGHVHFSFGKPITKFISSLTDDTRNDLHRLASAVSKHIDYQIHKGYKLWPNNYIAADLMDGMTTFNDKYTPEQKENFILYKKKQLEKFNGDKEVLEEIFLKIYANPVFNKITAKQSV